MLIFSIRSCSGNYQLQSWRANYLLEARCYQDLACTDMFIIFFYKINIIIIIIITRLVMRHMSIAVKRWTACADGLPWWSPSQVLATICCVFSVCVCLLLCNKVTFYPLSPLTSQVTVFLQCSQTLSSPSGPETVSIDCVLLHSFGDDCQRTRRRCGNIAGISCYEVSNLFMYYCGNRELQHLPDDDHNWNWKITLDGCLKHALRSLKDDLCPLDFTNASRNSWTI